MNRNKILHNIIRLSIVIVGLFLIATGTYAREVDFDKEGYRIGITETEKEEINSLFHSLKTSDQGWIRLESEGGADPNKTWTVKFNRNFEEGEIDFIGFLHRGYPTWDVEREIIKDGKKAKLKLKNPHYKDDNLKIAVVLKNGRAYIKDISLIDSNNYKEYIEMVNKYSISKPLSPSEYNLIKESFNRLDDIEKEMVKNEDNYHKFSRNLRLYERAEEIIEDFDLLGKSQLDQIHTIYRYMFLETRYTDGIDECECGYNSSSAHGVLIEGKGTCSGYAKAVNYLCELIGIESVSVNGWLNLTPNDGPSNHMWNKVRIDGIWYNLDTTQQINPTGLEVEYDSFLKSDREFRNKSINYHIEDDNYYPEAYIEEDFIKSLGVEMIGLNGQVYRQLDSLEETLEYVDSKLNYNEYKNPQGELYLYTRFEMDSSEFIREIENYINSRYREKLLEIEDFDYISSNPGCLSPAILRGRSFTDSSRAHDIFIEKSIF